MNSVTERLCEEIKRSGYSYGELSKLTGIPKSAIQRYATGETVKIPLDRLSQLASSLNVTSAYLMGWEEDNHEKFMLIFEKYNVTEYYESEALIELLDLDKR